VIVFGSFARAEAVAASDLDLVVVRAKGGDEDDVVWRAGVADWTTQVRRLTGNHVEVLEVSEAEVARLLRGRSPLWREVQRDGVVVFGAGMAELKGRRSA